jgi:serine/threonine protein phosphatase PrpC
MNISIGARTDIGGRSNNEDCLAVLDKERVPLRADAVLVIADGMGGRSNGEEASAIAVKIVRETVMQLLDPSNDQPLPPAEDILAAALRRANSTIYDLSQEHPDTPGMGTTCIAALISEGILTLAHVGDSRAYLVRDGSIKALTHDHTYVADQVRAGNMSAQAAKNSRFRNVITRAIGIAPTVEPDFETFPLTDNDTVLLCTDGLTNTIDENDICDLARRSETAQGTASALMDAAKGRGVRDNVTIIAVCVSSDVQSARIKRSQLLIDGVEEPSPQPVLAVQEANAQSTPEHGVERPDRVESPTASSSSGFRYVLVAVAFLLLGAIVTGSGLYAAGLIGAPAHSTKTASPAAAVRPDFATIQYDAPVQLFYKPIQSDFLLLGDKGAFVALSSTGKIVHLNGFGQSDYKFSSSLTAPAARSNSLSYGTDLANNLYVSNASTGTLTQISTDGKVKRVIAHGLTQPGSVAVNPNGDVYVVDGGELYVLHRHVSPGKP